MNLFLETGFSSKYLLYWQPLEYRAYIFILFFFKRTLYCRLSPFTCLLLSYLKKFRRSCTSCTWLYRLPGLTVWGSKSVCSAGITKQQDHKSHQPNMHENNWTSWPVPLPNDPPLENCLIFSMYADKFSATRVTSAWLCWSWFIRSWR